MASKYGARPVGTDGSDFKHRQRVALHYRESVTNKFRLKCAVLLHGFLLLLMLIKLLEDILDRFEIDWGPLERLKVPVPYFWEYWWMLSVVPCILALTSLPRNNERRLRRCYYGFFLFVLIPTAIGAGCKLPELLNYLGYYGDGSNDDDDDDAAGGPPRTYERFLGFPMVVIWWMFFAVAFQVHAFTMFFITHLIKAWQPATARQQNLTATGTTTTSPNSASVSTEKLSSTAAGNGNSTMWNNDKKVK